MSARNGSDDVARAARALGARLPAALEPLARLAYDYAWSWTPGGEELFASVDPYRWELCAHNPVRLLTETTEHALAAAATDDTLVGRAREAAARLGAHRARPSAEAPETAFFCTEFAVHSSLPVYSGGLGVLAGDILKEASDRALPYAGIGLLYRQGYFRQRIDPSGWPLEYWSTLDPDRMPGTLVTTDGVSPLTVSVRMFGRDIVAQVWRVDVGRVPLYLLDAERIENSPVDRWITSRLYVGDRRFRLAQYALLGIGGMRALRAMGLDPAVVHLNEGHAALAPLELALEGVRAGGSFDESLAAARARTVFTTHTPIGAGNEAYSAEEMRIVLGDLPDELMTDEKSMLALGRARAGDATEPFGMTPLGLRVSRAANGVSEIHGRVARAMWAHLYVGIADADVPIDAVTNGVHVPSWMAPPMRRLLDRHLGESWIERAADARTWEPLDDVPDAELWDARCSMRAALVDYARERAAADRLGRGESMEYAEAALRAFDPNVLTLGFARRATAYKRLYLLTHDRARALALLDGEQRVQMLLAGKPHPQDEEGKRIIQSVFELKWAPHVSERVAFLEDYDMRVARRLVSGCDVWINVPRPPLEACGTSGMKAAMNGGLNLSVLDGWWDEAYDGTNGWAIGSHPVGSRAASDHAAQDATDAAALYDILEREVVPLFYDRDANGIPRGWCARVRASLRTIGPRFNATRMLDEYRTRMY
jgi:starch phosphorylase